MSPTLRVTKENKFQVDLNNREDPLKINKLAEITPIRISSFATEVERTVVTENGGRYRIRTVELYIVKRML